MKEWTLHRHGRFTRRTLRMALAGLALGALTACATGGLSHTVPEAAIARVTGPDKGRIDSARTKVVAAQDAMKATDAEAKRADGAIKEADKGITQADKEIQRIEQELEKARRGRERAEEVKRLREAERELIDLNGEVRKREMLLARAQYELKKFEVVGRVESGSGPAYQSELAKFQGQVAEMQVEVSAAKEEAAAQGSRVNEIRRNLGQNAPR